MTHLRPDPASPPTGRDGPAPDAGQPRKEILVPHREAGSELRPTQQAILEAYAEAKTVAARRCANPEQAAFELVAFRLGVSVDAVKDVVIADQFNLGAG